MLDLLAIVAAAAGVAIVLILIYAATRPDHFTVSRSILIDAPADRLFPLINDFETFNSWNPFNKDPAMKGTYSGPKAGPGASYAFEAPRSGTGTISIVDTLPPSRVTMRLVMTKPLAADNRIDFDIEPQAGGNRVTWTMNGSVPYVAKIIHLVVNVDKMVGGQFDKGLAELKAVAAGMPQAAA